MFVRLATLFTFTLIFQNLFAQRVPRFESSDSLVIDIPANQKTTFGYLVVYEDQSKKAGKTLRLPVFILKSRSLNPKPDPVLYTAGGPGSSSVNTAKYGAYYSYLDDRDFIVFEQRGTGFAQPNLSCPELDSIKKTNTWINLSDAQQEAAQVKAAMRCQDRLIAAGNQLSLYNTKASAEDIEDLRKVLGIKQFNIYSVSYSTKIAQVLLRDHPTSIRSAVLDSPLPLWANYDETSLSFFNEKMDLLFNACATDSACRASFPGLKRKFVSFLDSANQNPIAVQLKSPIDSSLITVLLKGYQIASFINLGETYNLKGLPKLLHKICSGDYEVLKPFIYNLFSNDNRSMGMRLSVWCSEEYPFENLSGAIKTNSLSQYAGMKSSAVPLAICKVWKIERAKETENQPFQTSVPVLLINGEFDPDTPTVWGQELQKRFSKSFLFIFKGMSHTPTQNWDDGCGMQLAQSFFNEPLKRPELKCFKDLKRIEFDTNTINK
ncbi:MAG TPA: alpha/beta hydrolase [Chitinophagaceae bacterium]|nr:alpha/beta hydrolase [Chitinophagaceae bacterium]